MRRAANLPPLPSPEKGGSALTATLGGFPLPREGDRGGGLSAGMIGETR